MLCSDKKSSAKGNIDQTHSPRLQRVRCLTKRFLTKRNGSSSLEPLNQLRTNPGGDRRALHAEGKIAAEAKERHFPNLKAMLIRIFSVQL